MKNKIIARGKLISSGRSRNGYSEITVVVKKVLTSSTRISYVHFVLPQPLPSDVNIGDRVKIEGGVKGYSYFNESLGRMINVQYFVATSVEKEKTVIEEEFGVKGNFCGEPKFFTYIEGEVQKAMVSQYNNDWGRITVKTCGVGEDERPNYVTMSYYLKRNLPGAEDFSLGDKVVLYCSISTPQKEIDGEKRNFEDLVIEDIVITEKSPRDAQ